MKEQSTKCVVKGAAVKWAKVYEPDATYPPPRWSVKIYPTEAQAKELIKLGIVMREDDKGGVFFEAKRNVETTKGKKLDPPRVVGPDKSPFTKPIGNGSVCNIIVDVYPWEFGKKRGVGAWLEAVQVVEHVEYVQNDRVDFDAVEVKSDEPNDLPF